MKLVVIINQGECWNEPISIEPISIENKSRLRKNLLFIDVDCYKNSIVSWNIDQEEVFNHGTIAEEFFPYQILQENAVCG